MTEEVEIFSGIDPIHLPNRQVRYWLEFRGMRSEQLTKYRLIRAWAEALCSGHNAVLIDRSDKDSGYLRQVLAAELF